jgi:hypothetical protein
MQIGKGKGETRWDVTEIRNLLTEYSGCNLNEANDSSSYVT